MMLIQNGLEVTHQLQHVEFSEQ